MLLDLSQAHPTPADSSWLNPMFQSEMILQKAPNTPLIWGTGEAEENVKIEIFDASGQILNEVGAKVEEDGKWKVMLYIYIRLHENKISIWALIFSLHLRLFGAYSLPFPLKNLE